MGMVIAFPSPTIGSRPKSFVSSKSANRLSNAKATAARAQHSTAHKPAMVMRNNVVLFEGVFVEYHDNKTLTT